MAVRVPYECGIWRVRSYVMKRIVLIGTVLGTFVGFIGLSGCKQDPGPAPAGPGGFVPGQRAAERATPHLFELMQLEERDRIFAVIDESYAPILECLKTLDESRGALAKALAGVSYGDLGFMLSRKRITCSPERIDIVVGPFKQVDFKFGQEKSDVKLELSVPDGGKKDAWTIATSKGVGWRVKVPIAYSSDLKTSGPSPEQILAELKPAVANMKKLMDSLSKRLAAGDMVEASDVRRKLFAAGKPLGAAIQQIVYGKANLK